MSPYLHDPVPCLQSPVLSSGAVLQDVLDKDAPHHLAVAQSAAHPSAPDDADAKRLAWLAEELHPEVRVDICMLDSNALHTVFLTLRIFSTLCTHFLGWFQLP